MPTGPANHSSRQFGRGHGLFFSGLNRACRWRKLLCQWLPVMIGKISRKPFKRRIREEDRRYQVEPVLLIELMGQCREADRIEPILAQFPRGIDLSGGHS